MPKNNLDETQPSQQKNNDLGKTQPSKKPDNNDLSLTQPSKPKRELPLKPSLPKTKAPSQSKPKTPAINLQKNTSSQVKKKQSLNPTHKRSQQIHHNKPKPARPSPIAKNKPKIKKGNQNKSRLWLALFLFSVALGIMTVLGALLGYNQGQTIKQAEATAQMRGYLEEQYVLGLDDIKAGRYELARQRFAFIINQAPDFQEAFQRWIEVMAISTPQITATLQPTPTEDLRPIAELFQQANIYINAGNWDQVIYTLSSLRKSDPNYQTVWVDDMMYLALRNRGVTKILNLGQLESGLYDFSLAENFGPLDYEANNYRDWARLYIIGNSFWFAYPDTAANYYGMVAGVAPNLKDESGFTAFYRYWASLMHYADQLSEKNDWCAASDQYQIAYNASNREYLAVTATHAYFQCTTPTASPTITITPTITTTSAPITNTLTPTTSLLSITPSTTPTLTSTNSTPTTPIVSNTPSPSSTVPPTTITPTPTSIPSPTPNLPSPTP